MVRFGTVALGLGLCLSLALAVGCKKKDDASQPPGGPPSGGPPSFGNPMSPQEVLTKLPGGAEFAVGKKVYADNNCARCHKLGETGGMPTGGFPGSGGGPPMPPGGPGGPPMPPGGMGPPGMPRGPDLTRVGAAPEHTGQWLADHIRDPKKHTPDSRMPPYGTDKINDADLEHLVAYLASRKDAAPKDGGGKDGGGKDGGGKDGGEKGQSRHWLRE